MIKRIFITLFVFLYIGNNVFASNLPYTNSNVIKFNDIIGTNMASGGGENIYISPLGDVLYRSSLGNLYKKGINETGVGTEFTTQMVYSGAGKFVVFSSDGQYVYYLDGVENSYKIYKKGINEVGNGVAISSDMTIRSIVLSPDGQYIYYASLDGKIHKVSTSNPADNSIVITTTNCIPEFISPNGIFLFYKSGNEGYRLYKKDLASGDNGVAFTPGGADFSTISSDNSFVYYRNGNDGMKLYKKGINEVGDGIAINSLAVSYYKISPDNNTIVYTVLSNGWNIYVKSVNDTSNGTKFGGTDNGYSIALYGNILLYRNSTLNNIFKIDLSNPQGYGMTDNIYKSAEITNSDTGVYIKTDTTLPTGTDYEFWLANQNTQQVAVNEGGDTYLMMGTRLDDWSGMNNFTTLGLNVGDEIVIYKGGSEATTIITQINSMEIRFNNIGLMDDMGYGVKKGSANFQKLNNTVLDGDTEINTQTLFGSVTNKLFYQIVLTSSDATKTPVINSVDITATPQTVITPPTGGSENTATGGINLSLGDGASISIPVEKQTTDFIKTIATQPSINSASLNTYSNIETFLKDNNYDYTNQLLIGSGSIPALTMYNVVNLGLTNTSLSDTLSGAINSPSYAKLVLGQDTYLAGKRIINYLKMDKADDNGNLIISVYKPDTKEYIFLRKKD